MWNNMTGTTPGDDFVTEALVQQIYYLNFADSGLATSFLITKGGKKKKNLSKPLPDFSLLHPESLHTSSLLSTSEAYLKSCFSRSRKLY